MKYIDMVAVVSLILTVHAVPCPVCNGGGNIGRWVACEKCGGMGIVHNERITKWNPTFADGVTRKFHDGKKGYAVAPCPVCNRGLGDKRKGKVYKVDRCTRCKGTGSLDKESEARVSAGKNTTKEFHEATSKKVIVNVDPELELARQNLNTEAFRSYRCKFRESCPHCKSLFEKNQLTKSYCEQCFVCNKKMDEAKKFENRQEEEVKALKKAVDALSADCLL